MPWECGYFDGFDGHGNRRNNPAYAALQGHVAILPVVDEPESTFNGQEYLGLYCFAAKGAGLRRNIKIQAPYSINQNSTGVGFDKWIGGDWPT